MPYTTLTASIAGKLSVNQKGASRADTRVIESMVNTGPERGVSYQLPGIVLLKGYFCDSLNATINVYKRL